jgi:hypothetical protein
MNVLENIFTCDFNLPDISEFALSLISFGIQFNKFSKIREDDSGRMPMVNRYFCTKLSKWTPDL